MKIILTNELLDYLANMYLKSNDVMAMTYEEFVNAWIKEREIDLGTTEQYEEDERDALYTHDPKAYMQELGYVFVNNSWVKDERS